MKQALNLHLQGRNNANLITTLQNLFLSMHIYVQFQQKIAFFWPPDTINVFYNQKENISQSARQEV